MAIGDRETRTDKAREYIKKNFCKPRNDIIDECVEIYGLKVSTLKNIYKEAAEEKRYESDSMKRETEAIKYKGRPRQYFRFEIEQLFSK